MSSRPSALEEAERAGFDLSLIDANLRRSYDERARLHQQALDLTLELEEAGLHVIGRLGGVITLQDVIRAKQWAAALGFGIKTK